MYNWPDFPFCYFEIKAVISKKKIEFEQNKGEETSKEFLCTWAK